MATDNISSGVVKSSHHAVFDECWFHQPWRPSVAQLLYDLGTQLAGSHQSPHATDQQPHDLDPSLWLGKLK